MPVISKPNQHFEALTYTGNGSTQNITGLSFQPDFVWIKGRSLQSNHRLYDAIRGATNAMYSDLTSAEEVEATGLTAFLSGGFSLGSQAGHNSNGNTYVAWCWNAGGSTVTNTAGSVSAQVRANPTAGFSVVTYDSGSAGQKTAGHGLSSAPKFIITRARNNAAYNWSIYHASVSDNTSKFLRFTSDALVSSSTIWGASLPTSSVFGFTSDNGVEANKNCVAYCWSEVEGFSKFGSYTGNGSANGPFVYTGFRPEFIIKKRTTGTDNWMIHDAARDPVNLANKRIMANSNTAESTDDNAIDILSNGFKMRTTNTATNQSGETYIFAAFAENPFKYASAR